MQIAVIGSYDGDDAQRQLAFEVGKLIAEMGCTLVTGGRFGIMEAAAKGVKDGGGISVGILPGTDLSEANSYNTINIPSGLGYGRNMCNVLAADLVVAIGGGAGTLNEMSYAWMYSKPITAMTGSGGWADELAGRAIDSRKDEVVIACDSLEQLRQIIESHKA
jgi:uncharacterized protein (TIGR00725 family)